jgi:hypothetical protein
MLKGQAPEGRIPRSIVRVTGYDIKGVKLFTEQTTGFSSWDVTNNTYYEADLFSIDFATKYLPAAMSEAFFSSAGQIDVEIFAGFPQDPVNFTIDDMDSLIIGRVDDVTINMDARTIQVSGRDYTSYFIDNKSAEKYPNLTASQIVKKLAAKYGLKAQVTETTTKVGKYLEQDIVRMHSERSEWDLLTWLAGETLDANGVPYHVYVKGDTLYFAPQIMKRNPDTGILEPQAEKYVVRWIPADADTPFNQGPMTNDLILRRNLTVLRNVTVKVISYSSGDKARRIGWYPRNSRGISPGLGKVPAQLIERTIRGLTTEGCYARAQQIHREQTQHERKLPDLEFPADNTLNVGMLVQLTGTGTSFDQDFYPESVTRTFGWDSGYKMTVRAKNSSPESEVSL